MRITVWTWIRKQNLKSFGVNSFSWPQGLCICIHHNLVGQAFVQYGSMGINIPTASTRQRNFEFPQKKTPLGYICTVTGFLTICCVDLPYFPHVTTASTDNYNLVIL